MQVLYLDKSIDVAEYIANYDKQHYKVELK